MKGLRARPTAFPDSNEVTHFMKFLEREFPSMRPRFEKLYVTKYPPDAYRQEVQGMVRVLQARYGLSAHEHATSSGLPTTTSPSLAFTSKREASFQRSLIGSLTQPSMTRFRKRAPNARL